MANTLSFDPQCNSYTKPNADIAGIGVIVSIIVQSYFVLLVSLYSSYLAFRQIAASSETLRTKTRITNKILLMCSDAQGVLGFSILTASLSQIRRISLYHAFMAYHLAVLSVLSHFSALQYLFHEKLRTLIPRLFIIFTSLVMLVIFGVITWNRHLHWADKPGWCYRHKLFQDPPQSLRIEHLSLMAFQVIAYLLIFVVQLPRSPFRIKRSTFYRVWIPFSAITHAVFVVIVTLGISSVFIASIPLLVDNNGLGDREQELWGFGQVIAVLTLLAMIFATYGIWDEDQDGSGSHNSVEDKLRKELSITNAKLRELEPLLTTRGDPPTSPLATAGPVAAVSAPPSPVLGTPAAQPYASPMPALEAILLNRLNTMRGATAGGAIGTNEDDLLHLARQGQGEGYPMVPVQSNISLETSD